MSRRKHWVSVERMGRISNFNSGEDFIFRGDTDTYMMFSRCDKDIIIVSVLKINPVSCPEKGKRFAVWSSGPCHHIENTELLDSLIYRNF